MKEINLFEAQKNWRYIQNSPKFRNKTFKDYIQYLLDQGWVVYTIDSEAGSKNYEFFKK